MCEIFQGAKQEVKHEVNEWFTANPGVSIRYVLQDVVCVGHVASEVTLTIIYDEPECREGDTLAAEVEEVIRGR